MGKKELMGVGVFVVVAVLAVAVVSALWNFYSNAVLYENGIKAQYAQNKNNFANGVNEVREVAQVPSMYTDDLVKVWSGVMQDRYGKDGSRALFQWIREHNPKVDPSLYQKLQVVIVTWRNSFMADQKMLIDKRNQYQNYFGQPPSHVFYAWVLGFPRIDLSQYDIVTSAETERTFDTKKSEPIQLR